jgi:hypothetical protein
LVRAGHAQINIAQKLRVRSRAHTARVFCKCSALARATLAGREPGAATGLGAAGSGGSCELEGEALGGCPVELSVGVVVGASAAAR